MPRPPKNRASRPPQDENEVAGVRIIGGTLRGRTLEYSGDARTRPMKDRVRESVFNLVGPAAAGKHAIDLFAGTGALGLEAISRGATFATLIERHYPTSQLIKKNAAAIGIAQKCEVIFGDAFLWARHLKSQISDLKSPVPWLVFCSPPYEFYVARREEMLSLLQSLWTSAPVESLFVVEADERFDYALLPAPESWDVRSYRPAFVGIAEKPNPGTAAQTGKQPDAG